MTGRPAPSCPVPARTVDRIELGHGGGGRMTHRLIKEVIRPSLDLSQDDVAHDGAVLLIDGGRIAFTTDSYVIRPLFFPGGDIGSLAVHGTVNDLAMCGAKPLHLSVGLVIEEGLPIGDLRQILGSMRVAAQQAGVTLVTGDTKVVERGRGDGLYVSTSGVGVLRAGEPPHPRRVKPGDAVLVSGDVGRHGLAVLCARERLDFETPPQSDTASVAGTVMALYDAGVVPHCLRDPTRGGLAASLVEIARSAAVDIRIDEAAIPISDPVRGACELLGLDPLHAANEGRFIAFVDPSHTDTALAVLRDGPGGEHAAVIGHVAPATRALVLMGRISGGTQVLDLPLHEQFPRIC
ncbi:MAG: hydrogenase expression/formation protein HypE [Acetobacteraceae bacterium]